MTYFGKIIDSMYLNILAVNKFYKATFHAYTRTRRPRLLLRYYSSIRIGTIGMQYIIDFNVLPQFIALLKQSSSLFCSR